MTLTLDSQGQTLNCMCLKWSDQWTRNRGKIYCWVICLIYKLMVELASDLYPELGFGQTQIPNWSVVCISCMICFIHDLNLQHRLSATGWLLFMRCVSFTFIRLLPTWTPTEIFDSFYAKHFSYCDSIICPIKSKLRFLKVCKILKRTWHFQTDWILCALNCSGCSHVVNDAGSTCSCC